MLETERENTSSRSLEGLFLKRLWTCHQTDVMMMKLIMMMMMMMTTTTTTTFKTGAGSHPALDPVGTESTLLRKNDQDAKLATQLLSIVER